MTRDKATGVIRISKDAQAKIRDLSAKTGLNSAALLDHFLNISDQSSLPTPVSPPPAPDSPIKKKRREQPSQGLIDAFIMNVWGASKLHLIPDLRIDAIQPGLKPYEWDAEVIKRELAFQAEIKKLQVPISRKDILKETYEALINRGWGTIYPGWYKALKDNHGDFQMLIDKRLASLVKNGYITRSKGIYRQHELLMREIDLIAGIIELIPQNNLKITRLLSREVPYQANTWRKYVEKQ